jgi:hypothetical protein
LSEVKNVEKYFLGVTGSGLEGNSKSEILKLNENI